VLVKGQLTTLFAAVDCSESARGQGVDNGWTEKRVESVTNLTEPPRTRRGVSTLRHGAGRIRYMQTGRISSKIILTLLTKEAGARTPDPGSLLCPCGLSTGKVWEYVRSRAVREGLENPLR